MPNAEPDVEDACREHVPAVLEFTYRQVATILGTPEGTVTGRMAGNQRRACLT